MQHGDAVFLQTKTDCPAFSKQNPSTPWLKLGEQTRRALPNVQSLEALIEQDRHRNGRKEVWEERKRTEGRAPPETEQ
jgi:hypothetical protein